MCRGGGKIGCGVIGHTAQLARDRVGDMRFDDDLGTGTGDRNTVSQAAEKVATVAICGAG